MIAFYIMGMSMKTLRNILFVDSDRFNPRKGGGEDENCNRKNDVLVHTLSLFWILIESFVVGC
jgi:hypothetical protein